MAHAKIYVLRTFNLIATCFNRIQESEYFASNYCMKAQFEPTLAFASTKDEHDPLSKYRNQFLIPKHDGRDSVYLCGNSLGLQPVGVAAKMEQELKDWATYGVEGHFQAKNPWFSYHHLFSQRLSKLAGALPEEVVVMNTLSVNIHLLMMSFYRPSGKRCKILMEAGAFPSDQYIVETQVRMHGLDPLVDIIEVAPRTGGHLIQEQDLLEAIEQAGDTLALVLFGGVNYYTGQLFNISEITTAAHKVGAYAGFDLAHAAGNVMLDLHDWNVDFAAWCSYKYLNSGPGAAGCVFVHQRHGDNANLFRLGGWWGNEEKSRFKMAKDFVPQKGAASWQMSNAPVFNMVALNASLDLFEAAGMDALLAKSKEMTAYLYYLLHQKQQTAYEVITPNQTEKRGCQLSLLFNEKGREVFQSLTAHGIIADWREPNVIRIAPVPLYNTFSDCLAFYQVIDNLL